MAGLTDMEVPQMADDMAARCEFRWLWTYDKQTFSITLRCDACGRPLAFAPSSDEVLIADHVCSPSLLRRLRRWLTVERADA